MKNSLKRLDLGFSQIFLLLGMLLVAVSLPIATKLVQQSQENRGRATDLSGYGAGVNYSPLLLLNTASNKAAVDGYIDAYYGSADAIKAAYEAIKAAQADLAAGTIDQVVYDTRRLAALNARDAALDKLTTAETLLESMVGSDAAKILISEAKKDAQSKVASEEVAEIKKEGKLTSGDGCTAGGEDICGANGYKYCCSWNPDDNTTTWNSCGTCSGGTIKVTTSLMSDDGKLLCKDDDVYRYFYDASASPKSESGWGLYEECSYGCTSGACNSKPDSGNPSNPSNPSNSSSDDGSGGSSTVITGITLSPKTLTLRVGESAVITATLAPVGLTDKLTWSTDNAAVATVTNDGLVTGIAVGETVIRAVTSNGIEASINVKVIPDDDLTLSFKVAFAGIKPSYVNNEGDSYSCIGSLGDLTIEILNRPTNTYESHSGVEVAVVGNETDSLGNQVFQVTNLEIGSTFATVNTFNNVKVKGPFHLKRRMCQNGQSGKLDETTVCDIDFTEGSYVYDFSEYTLLAGDVNQDGMINSQDFSYVKNAWDGDAEPECGRKYDLNLDGVVNHIDKQLVLTALSFKDDD